MTTREYDMEMEAALLRRLSPEQQETWKTKSYFLVKAPDRTYCIHKGLYGNIWALCNEGEKGYDYKDMQIFQTWCVQPAYVHYAHAQIVQLLYFLHDPETIHRIAVKNRAA